MQIKNPLIINDSFEYKSHLKFKELKMLINDKIKTIYIGCCGEDIISNVEVFDDGNDFLIQNLYIREDYRGCGITHHILNLLINKYGTNKLKGLYLDVDENNFIIKTYNKYKFKEVFKHYDSSIIRMKYEG